MKPMGVTYIKPGFEKNFLAPMPIETIPGIGKKTAERLVIEMKDKLKGRAKPESLASTLIADAMNALMNLGYNPLHAQKAVQAALEEKKDENDLGKLITSALQKI